MMDASIIRILEVSVSAAMIIIAVVGLRLVFRKTRASKRALLLLWVVVALRLMIPVSITAPFGFLPSFLQNGSSSTTVLDPVSDKTDKSELSSNGSGRIARRAEEIAASSETSVVSDSKDKATSPFSWEALLLIVYCVGVTGMLAYYAISNLILARRLKNSELVEHNVYSTDTMGTAFVFGILRPRIFIPVSVKEEFRDMALKHESAHVAHGDHILKALAFLLLAIHWFNPFVWLAYFLFLEDLEYACDERVVKEMDVEERKRYSEALLSFSYGNGLPSAIPVAFGKKKVVGRIKAVCGFQKPVVLLGVLAVLSSFILGACLIPGSGTKESDQTDSNAAVRESDSVETDLQNGSTPDPALFSATEIRLNELHTTQSYFVTGYNESGQGILYFLYYIIPEDHRAGNFKYYLVRYETASLTDAFWTEEAVAVRSCRRGEINGADWNVLWSRFYALRETEEKESGATWDPTGSIGFWGSECKRPLVQDIKDNAILALLQAEYEILGTKEQLVPAFPPGE